MIPNSCFSVLHVPIEYDRVLNSTSINLTLPGSDFNETWNGSWMDMVVQFGNSMDGYEDQYDTDAFNLSDYAHVDVNLTIFVTNEVPISRDMKGFIGMAPCPPKMSKYSFLDQITKRTDLNSSYGDKEF